MADYSLEEKASFTVLGFGTEITSDYRDQVGINKEKSNFWQKAKQDGRLDKLKKVAENDDVFIVNEAINNKMMHYVGVLTKENLPDATRLIQFPAGEYIVVKGEAHTEEALSNELTGIAFGEVLMKVKDVSYVGGPNTAVLMGQKDDLIYGEMWIPVVRN